MKTIRTVSALSAELATARQSGEKISFVPTMGAIHAGHLSLIEIAKKQTGFVVAPIYALLTLLAKALSRLCLKGV